MLKKYTKKNNILKVKNSLLELEEDLKVRKLRDIKMKIKK